MDIQLVRNVLNGSILLILSIEDIKYKELSAVTVFLYILLGFMFWLAGGIGISELELLIPGILMIAISFLSKEKIGYGDGLVVLGAMLFMGEMEGIHALICSFILVGIFSWGYMAAGLLSDEEAHSGINIPYIPFLFAGVGIYEIYRYQI